MTEPSSTTADYPYLVLDSPYEVANWRPLLHWIMVIPHSIVVYVLQILANVLFLIYWIIVVFTGKPNRGLYDMITMYERYNTRTTSFLLGFSEIYPPFDFSSGPQDNGAYAPLTLTLHQPPEVVPRTAALNFILAIPHYLVFWVYSIGGIFAAIAGWFAVLFTGRWPQGLRDFLVRLTNYYYRVWSYVVMVNNEYPRFGLPAA